ncbi:MAG: hypothetical protein R2844_01500 [Caldilineales bacterium]
MVVNDAAWDGVHVNVAGNPSSATFSGESNGFEVAGAEGSGLMSAGLTATASMLHQRDWSV